MYSQGEGVGTLKLAVCQIRSKLPGRGHAPKVEGGLETRKFLVFLDGFLQVFPLDKETTCCHCIHRKEILVLRRFLIKWRPRATD